MKPSTTRDYSLGDEIGAELAHSHNVHKNYSHYIFSNNPSIELKIEYFEGKLTTEKAKKSSTNMYFS